MIIDQMQFLLANMVVKKLPIGEEIRNEKYAFPSFDGRETLKWLKNLALEPCNMRLYHQKFQNQMLEVRKHLNASSQRLQRKMKFNQYVNDSKLASSFGLIGREKYENKKSENRRRDGSSSLSSSLCFKEKCVSIRGTQGQVAFPAFDDGIECCSICGQDNSLFCDRAQQGCSLQGRAEYSQLREFDESIKGPNPMKQEKLKKHCKGFVAGGNFTHSFKRSIKEEPYTEISNGSKSFSSEDIGDPSKASSSLSSEMDGMDVDQQPMSVIPVGPRFQAEVPKWGRITNTRQYYDDSKWLGIQTWPISHIKETDTRDIVKRRSDSCSCNIPGSFNCVRQHVSEARKLLQSDIGAAFSSWKFNEMGENVSKSWTLEEQKEFISLVKLNPLSSDGTSFWKLAMEHIPAKSLKSMVKFYYNVYIPRRMSMETRSSFGGIDSDDDQNDEDYKNEDVHSTTRMSIVPIRKWLKSKV